jgi:putative ABC transport system permease protein
VIEARLPVPAAVAIYPGPLAEAALYGVLTALIFTLWPLARTEQVRAAALYRDAAGHARVCPRPRYLVALAAALAGLIGLAVWFSGVPRLALGAAGGIAGRLSCCWRRHGRSARWHAAPRGRARYAAARRCAGAGGGRRPGGEAASVVLSLGLGLSCWPRSGRSTQNLRAPSPRPAAGRAQLFLRRHPDRRSWTVPRPDVENDPPSAGSTPRRCCAASSPASTASRRREVAGDHWVLQGDRGVTYSDAPPPGTQITEGAWWPEDYAGPPLISLRRRGGPRNGPANRRPMTVNILGRDITAEIASFREVDFSTAGIGFILAMNPARWPARRTPISPPSMPRKRPRPRCCAMWRARRPTSPRSG